MKVAPKIGQKRGFNAEPNLSAYNFIVLAYPSSYVNLASTALV